MKKIILTILPLLLVVGCSKIEGKQDLIPIVETYEYGDIKSITYHKIIGNKIELFKIMNWYKNGQKKEEGTYKDGKQDGLWTSWYKNGQKMYEGAYKDGKADGKWTRWYEDGQKMETTYKDGYEDGKWTIWDKNGKKSSEGTYKDGKMIVE